MNGYLSQAIANLQATEKQISNLSGLPSAAQKIQAESVTVISSTLSTVQATQHTILSFVKKSVPELNEIDAMLANNQPLPSILAAIENVKNETITLQSDVDETTNQIKTASVQILSYFNRLATIESDLTTQMFKLQSQRDYAKDKEEATKKKYYYLLALGPFGLIGLATALGLYLKWKSDVNDYESQINALNNQISALKTMQAASQLLGSDFRGVMEKISGVKNAVDFLSSDILIIESNLNENSIFLIIEIKIKAAITEVQTLGVDAS